MKLPAQRFVFISVVALYCALCCESHQTFCNQECQPSSNLEECKVTKIDDPPWSTNETTAPAPKFISADWYLYKSKKNWSIGLNVTWLQKAVVVEQYVEGYYLSVSKGGYQGSYKYKFDIPKPASSKKNEDIEYNFYCYGRQDSELILPGDYIVATLHALPLYQKNTANQGNDCFVMIPGCSNSDMKKTWPCQEEVDDEHIDEEYEYYEEPTDSLYYETSTTKPMSAWWSKDLLYEKSIFTKILIAVGASVGIVLCVIAIACYTRSCTFNCDLSKYKYMATNGKAANSCLILTSTTSGELDSDYCKATSALSDIFKKQSGMEVMCNLWEHTGMHNPIDWTTEHLLSHNHIILVCTPLGKDNCIRAKKEMYKPDVVDPFVMGVNAMLKSYKQKQFLPCKHPKYHVVYFDNNPSVCVPEELLQLVGCHRLMQNFNAFNKQITGKYFKVSNKEDDQLHTRLLGFVNSIKKYSKLDYLVNYNHQSKNNHKEKPSNQTEVHSLKAVPDVPNEAYNSHSLPENEYSTISSCPGSRCSCHSESSSYYVSMETQV
uniref:Uncharacterized protein LOC100179646 n=1 Tax=Phallusia mammillata TaxID=59560 RepID=A0A6F9DGI8_9ASCI|nr:uncharacterized protein LOC100179646 [Phallusia mammillata]